MQVRDMMIAKGDKVRVKTFNWMGEVIQTGVVVNTCEDDLTMWVKCEDGSNRVIQPCYLMSKVSV